MRKFFAALLAALSLTAHAATLGVDRCLTAGANIACENIPNDSGQTLDIQRVFVPAQPGVAGYTLIEVTFGGVSYTSQPNAFSLTGPHTGVNTLSAVVTEAGGTSLQLNALVNVGYTICSGRGCVSRQTWTITGGSVL